MCEFKNDHFDNKKVHVRYINRFISLNSLEEFAKFKLFPNIKEVTESFACLAAAEKYVMPTGVSKDRTDVQVIVVGDGGTPRTAATFAFLTKWKCVSVDPQMNMKKQDWSQINNLTVYKDLIDNVELTAPKDINVRVLIYPHSHAPFNESVHKLIKDAPNCETWIIAMPCCVSNELNDYTGIVYKDKFVMSPKNEMKIWCTNQSKLNII